MCRYIDADALIHEYYKNPTYLNLCMAINNAPTADVVERKKGKWKQGCCSECGYNWGKDAPIASVPNYCPNCGAKMKGENNDKN